MSSSPSDDLTVRGSTPASLSPGAAWYGLILLMLAFMLAMVSRVILGLLVEPVEQDLHVSDTQFGLLNGLAFVLFYLTMGVPMGRLADRMSRQRIVIISVALWSLATALCGLARSFTALFFARMGVGVGEAGLTPAAFSMLPDMFPQERLGRAYAIYNAGALLGFGASFLIGGSVIGIVERHGPFDLPFFGVIQSWQMVFMLVGMLGIPLILLTAWVQEPPRKSAGKQQGSFKELLLFMRQEAAVVAFHFVAYSCLSGMIYGTLAWLPAIFGRDYGVDKVTIGTVLGIGLGVASPLGSLAGGWLNDSLAARGRRDAPMIVGLIGVTMSFLLMIISSFIPGTHLAELVYCGLFFSLTMIVPTGMTSLQAISPAHIRAQMAAVYAIITGIGGMTLGTLLIGVLTDYVFKNKNAINTSVAVVGASAALAMGITLVLFRPRFVAYVTRSRRA